MSFHAADREVLRLRREARGKMMRERWADEEYRARQKAKRSAAWTAWWADPEKSAKRRAQIAAFNASPEQRAASKKRMKERSNEPDEKARQSTRMKEIGQRPDVKARAREHARKNALAINARRRARGDFVPEGKMGFYNKLRQAGFTRAAALRECRREP